jgi:transketolase
MDNLELCKKIRRTILKTSYKAGACHIGSALSCVEIIVDIYFNRMKPNDIFIFSKASGVATLYAVLAEKGIIPENKLAYYLKNYPLASSEVPGVFCSVGSLGHGLPIAVGVALSDRSRDVYCLISDAEVQEGTFWESILFAHHHELKNLKVIVDYNGWQACGRTDDIIKLTHALDLVYELHPIEVVWTLKGNGVSYRADDNTWHYMNLTLHLLNKALKELE